MTDEKIRMPASMGGLVRYFEEYKSKIQIKPGIVVVLSILIAILIIILNIYGNALLGL